MNRKDILKTIKSIIVSKQKNKSSKEIIYSSADEEACPSIEPKKIIS